jgi:nucleoside-diphosphate-sugar epimerase
MNWTDKQVFVTGANGFVGGHLVEHLCGLGCRVKAFVSSDLPGPDNAFEGLPAEWSARITTVSGDIRDRGCVGRAMAGSEVVIHLAALASVPMSLDSPETYVATNVSGTLNILEEARRQGVERVLTTSTSEVYAIPATLPIAESHPQQARTPYAATKIAADRIAESYYRSFGLPVTVVRPFNVFGPRQSTRAVIPSLITQLLSGKDEILMGTPHPTRDMNFVVDTVAAYVKIAESEATHGLALNVATGVENTIGSIAERLIAMIRPSAKLIIDPSRWRGGPNPHDRIRGSSQLLKDLTGWAPAHTFDQGLADTVEWFSRQARQSK